MYVLSEELKSLYPAFLSTSSFAQGLPPVMLQAGSGSGLKSAGRIRIRSNMDRIRNTASIMVTVFNLPVIILFKVHGR